MYDLPTGIGLIPDLSASAALVAGDLGTLATIWMVASVVAFLVVLPLAARRPGVARVELPAAALDADLREAA